MIKVLQRAALLIELVILVICGSQPPSNFPVTAATSSVSLPPLEIVEIDIPTARTTDAWQHWYAGTLHIRNMSLDAEENVIWLATASGLLRWDLDDLDSTLLTEFAGISAEGVAGVLVSEPGQVWAVLEAEGFMHESAYGRAYAKWIALYDQGKGSPCQDPHTTTPCMRAGWIKMVRCGWYLVHSTAEQRPFVALGIPMAGIARVGQACEKTR